MYLYIYILKRIIGSSWIELLDQLRRLMGSVYKEHSYLVDELTNSDKNDFQRIMNNDITYLAINTALQDLSKHLAIKYKSKCIVLLNACEAPIDAAYEFNYYNEAKRFFSKCLILYSRYVEFILLLDILYLTLK